MPEKVCEFEFCISLYFPTPPRLGVIIWGTDKICQRSAPVWLMSVLQIQRTIPYNARKAVAGVRKKQAGKEVTEREDMEKAFPPVLSNLNFVVVAGYGPVENAGRGASRPPRPALISWVVFSLCSFTFRYFSMLPAYRQGSLGASLTFSIHHYRTPTFLWNGNHSVLSAVRSNGLCRCQ